MLSTCCWDFHKPNFVRASHDVFSGSLEVVAKKENWLKGVDVLPHGYTVHGAFPELL